MSDDYEDDFAPNDRIATLQGKVVLTKMINGDLLIGIYDGYDDNDEALILRDPLVITSTAGFILMTDYVPFLPANPSDSNVLNLNFYHTIYFEPVSPAVEAYYHTSCKYRDMIKDDMSDIITKSQALIVKTMDNLVQERAAEDAAKTATNQSVISDHSEKLTVDQMFEDIEQPAKPEPVKSSVVDFASILAETLKNKKKDTLN